MNILITGGTGFIGSRLLEALVARKTHSVSYTGRNEPPKISAPEAKFLRGDLADETFARRCTQGIEAVVHCAGMAGTWGPYADYHRANVLATKNLLEAAKANGVKRIINLSSPSIYFDFKDQLDLKEDYLPSKFSNAYAQTKYEAEMLMHACHSPSLQTVSLRPRSVIGRGDQNVLPRLIRLQQTGSLVQVGRGENVVDVTTIGNLLDAIFLCLEAGPEAMGETYNITNGEPGRFWDFVDEVLRTANLPLRRKKVPYAPVMALARLNEWASVKFGRKREPALLPISVGIISFSMTLDISKARAKLGYVPRLSTRDGIADFFRGKN